MILELTLHGTLVYDVEEWTTCNHEEMTKSSYECVCVCVCGALHDL